MYKCLFCKFIDGTSPCTKSYENDKIMTFVDWCKWEGVHIVAFPKQHIGFKDKGTLEYEEARKAMHDAIPSIVEFENIDEGYYVLTEEDEISVGQNEGHVHIHITGKRKEK